jgi:hypothetical protein
MKELTKRYKSQQEEINQKYYLLMGAMGTAMSLIDDIRSSKIFGKELKQKLNAAYKEMLLHESTIGNARLIEEGSGLRPVDVWKQQDECYQYFESWLLMLFSVPAERHEKLNNYIELGFKMYAQ